jgi:hypothetical protein
LAGAIDDSTVSDIRVTGTVAASGVSYAGGVAGEVASTPLTRIHAYVTVNAPSTTQVGGIAGSLQSGSDTEESHAEGTVIGANLVGGLVGTAMSSQIVNAYATATVQTSGAESGGIAGSLLGATIEKSYAAGVVPPTGGALAGKLNDFGGLVTSFGADSTQPDQPLVGVPVSGVFVFIVDVAAYGTETNCVPGNGTVCIAYSDYADFNSGNPPLDAWSYPPWVDTGGLPTLDSE